MKKDNELFLEYINDLITHQVVQNMRNVPQHVKGVNCLDHSILVAFISFKLAKKFGGDSYAATRAGLLHDSFQTHWNKSETTLFKHLMTHPEQAVKTASIFNLSEVEVEAIQSHMWPVTIKKVPKNREAIYVNVADKISTIIEVSGLYALIVMKYKLKKLSSKSKSELNQSPIVSF